jgi:RHS repeat-associated protein
VGADPIDVSFGYDALGRRTRVTDGRGSQWWTTYTSWGSVSSEIEPATLSGPDLGDRTFETKYDSSGQPVTEIRPGGVIVTHTYDNLGRRVSSAGGSAGGTRNVSYDLAGRAVGWSSGVAATIAEYDDRSKVVATNGAGGLASFTYDAAGRMTKREDGAGVTTYSWDPAGRLGTLVDPLTGSETTYVWTAAGQLSSYTVQGGGATQSTYGYDPFGRVASEAVARGGTVLHQNSYTYNSVGGVASKTTSGTAALQPGLNLYGYDWANRLTSWTNPAGAVRPYDYDGSGNRIIDGAVSSTYDERNRLISSGGTAYSWSPRGTLDQTSDSNGSTAYTFDGLDRMTSAGSTVYTYDGLDRVASRNGVAFTYSGLLKQPTGDGNTTVARTPDGNPVSMSSTSGPASSLFSDGHGDITLGVSPQGAVQQSSVFDPYGSVIDRVGNASALAGFQGSYTDPATAIQNFGARWYEPNTGFLSRDDDYFDPYVTASHNRYIYAYADPIRFSDPDGHVPAYREGHTATFNGQKVKVNGRQYRNGQERCYFFTVCGGGNREFEAQILYMRWLSNGNPYLNPVSGWVYWELWVNGGRADVGHRRRTNNDPRTDRLQITEVKRFEERTAADDQAFRYTRQFIRMGVRAERVKSTGFFAAWIAAKPGGSKPDTWVAWADTDYDGVVVFANLEQLKKKNRVTYDWLKPRFDFVTNYLTNDAECLWDMSGTIYALEYYGGFQRIQKCQWIIALDSSTNNGNDNSDKINDLAVVPGG